MLCTAKLAHLHLNGPLETSKGIAVKKASGKVLRQGQEQQPQQTRCHQTIPTCKEARKHFASSALDRHDWSLKSHIMACIEEAINPGHVI